MILQRLKPTRWTMLVLLLLMLPFNLFFFPARRNYLRSLSDWQNPTIDVWFAYTPREVYAILPDYTAEGRLVYAVSEVTMDVAYPILYTALLGLLQAALLASLFSPTQAVQRLRVLPTVVLALDILENLSLAVILLGYPTRLDGVAWLASLFTSLKWITGLSLLFIIFLAAAVFGLRQIRDARSRK